MQYPGLLLEIDALRNYSEALLGHRAETVAMRATKAHGGLRRANERVAEFRGGIPIASLWGDRAKASADMISLVASRPLWSARTDPHRRVYASADRCS